MIADFLRSIRISSKIRSRSAISLLYHAAADSPYDPHQHMNLHYVDSATLLRQIRYVRKRLEFLPADEFMRAVQSGRSARVACLTFDDGYRDCWDSVIPRLDALGIPVEFYVNSSFVQGGFFWRDQIRYVISQGLASELIEYAGWQNKVAADQLYGASKNPQVFNSLEVRQVVDAFIAKKKLTWNALPFCTLSDLRKIERFQHVRIGNHTHSHFVLSSLTPAQQHHEIESCQQFLEANFPPEKISRVFSIPFGNAGTYNMDTLQILRQRRFTGAFTTDAGAYLSKGPLMEMAEELILFKRLLPKQYWRPF